MQLTEYSTKSCYNCGAGDNEPNAKFCGSCGASWNFSAPQTDSNTITEPPPRAPSFANVQRLTPPKVSKELQAEAGALLVMLARERIFLYIHWLFFFALNLAGCWLAWKCYAEFIGDEMSKMMVASTPFLFVNSLALLCLVPIKGTRNEIARLKEKLSYVRFKIEFGHLM